MYSVIRNLHYHLAAIAFLLLLWVLTLPINTWQLIRRLRK